MSTLDEHQVIAYLQQNADFLQNHPELLTRLSVFHEPQGTTSLIRRQQALMHDKNAELSNKLSALLDNASNNEHIFKIFNQCHRILLQATTFSEVNDKLQRCICKGFNLLDCQLVKFESDKHQTFVSQRLSEKTSFLGRLSQDEQFLFFSQSAPSSAIYLIGTASHPIALLAFASNDEAHYHPEQSSVFVLEFIKALEIKLNQL